MKKFRITRGMCSRFAAFVAGTSAALAPVDFSNFIESGNIWYVCLGVLDVSLFWIALFTSHTLARKRKGGNR